LELSYVAIAKWNKNVKVKTFGETNPKNTKRLQTTFSDYCAFRFVAELLQLPDSDFLIQGDLPAQPGDETEPKGAPALAKKRPSEIEGRLRIAPRAIRKLQFG
jgi:hypothetical protein